MVRPSATALIGVNAATGRPGRSGSV